jgi:hypothetical protein
MERPATGGGEGAMRGAVRPRVLAVAAAAAVCLVALGAIATVAVWGFRHGDDRSSATVGSWLAVVWVGVAVAVVLVVVVALAGARALRRPLLDLSRQANQLQVERIPAALREIEAGGEPAPRPGFTAPPELEGVAGALENLERFVHYHAKRAQRADRDLGWLLTGAADRAGARARLAEGIDLEPLRDLAAGLHRDEDALRALVPTAQPNPTDAEPSGAPVPGPSVTETLTMAAATTLRPPSVGVGQLEPALVDQSAAEAVVVVLGEVLDVALAIDGDIVVSGSVQPEGYHFVIGAPIGDQSAQLSAIAESLREREPVDLPFGLRAAVHAGRAARLLVWVTIGADQAQWHVLVPPDAFVRVPTATPAAVPPAVEPVTLPAPPPEPVVSESAPEPAPEPVVEPESPSVVAPSVPVDEAARVASDRRLGDALTNLFARLEVALERSEPGGAGLDEDERIALLVDGTRLVGKLQQAGLCSSRALRALLRAIDVAVGADRTTPLTGSARSTTVLPREILAEIHGRIAANGTEAKA